MKVIYTGVVEATVYVSLYMLLLQVCPHQHAELCELGGGGSLRFLSQLLLLVLPTREHDVIGELKSSSQLRCSKETEWHVAGAKVFSKLYPVHLAGEAIIDGTKMIQTEISVSGGTLKKEFFSGLVSDRYPYGTVIEG